MLEGKSDALILDHSDTTERLGFVTDIHHDELDDYNVQYYDEQWLYDNVESWRKHCFRSERCVERRHDLPERRNL